jgi:hypothetical protein
MNAPPSIRAILENPRRLPGANADGPPPAARQAESQPEYEPYAKGLIGFQSQHVLVFRQASGRVRGFSYSYFYDIDTDDPASGFMIDFTHAKVRVTGQNLEALFRLVCQHRVAEIVELGRGEQFEAADNEPIVDDIHFENASS